MKRAIAFALFVLVTWAALIGAGQALVGPPGIPRWLQATLAGAVAGGIGYYCGQEDERHG